MFSPVYCFNLKRFPTSLLSYILFLTLNGLSSYIMKENILEQNIFLKKLKCIISSQECV